MKVARNMSSAKVVVLTVLLSCCFSAIAQKAANAGDARTRLQTAVAMYQERCKRAGEKIHETAENVDAVFLLKLRLGNINRGDQFKFDDPYGRDLRNEGYIESFLRGSSPQVADPIPGAPPRVGYSYVEAVDPGDGKRYRYVGRIQVVGRKLADSPNVQIELKNNPNYDLNNYAFVMNKTLALGSVPRFGVTYDDISTREEREYWIAGSSLKVIDLKTNKIMAERIGYMIDMGQGDSGGGRAPWLLAANNACPGFQRNPYQPLDGRHNASEQPRQTQDFVEKVLKPKRDL